MVKFKTMLTFCANNYQITVLFECHASIFIIIFRNDKEYLEFQYAIKIPVRLLKSNDSEIHKYKYHVESPATRNRLINSLEFIVGPHTGGGIIDRFLAIHFKNNLLKVGCKWISNMFKIHVHTYVYKCISNL